MKDKIVISVIVPVYNVEAYLQRCLNSIVQQTYSQLEIIVIDDGSTDGSGFICDQYQKYDNRIKVIHQKNKGLSSARNAGLRMARGKYISFVDSDDWLEINAFELLINCVVNSNLDIVCFDYYVSYNDNELYRSRQSCELEIFNGFTALEQLVNGTIENYSCLKMYKKDLFDDIFFPENKTYEDIGTTYKLFLKADRIGHYHLALYHYYQRDDSITHLSKRSNEQFLKDAETVFLFKTNMINDICGVYPKMFPLLVSAAEEWAFKLYNCTLMLNNNDLAKKHKKMAKSFLGQYFMYLIKSKNTSGKHKLRLVVLRFLPIIYDKVLFPYTFKKRGNLS